MDQLEFSHSFESYSDKILDRLSRTIDSFYDKNTAKAKGTKGQISQLSSGIIPDLERWPDKIEDIFQLVAQACEYRNRKQLSDDPEQAMESAKKSARLSDVDKNIIKEIIGEIVDWQQVNREERQVSTGRALLSTVLKALSLGKLNVQEFKDKIKKCSTITEAIHEVVEELFQHSDEKDAVLFTFEDGLKEKGEAGEIQKVLIKVVAKLLEWRKQKAA